MTTITKSNIEEQVREQLPGWKYKDNAIHKDFTFRSFVEAFSFMTAVALEAEKMDHHPDWCNAYNKVSVSLTTHSAAGVTSNDFALALKMEKIQSKIGGSKVG